MAQINKPDTYFNTVLYTGNGSTQSITGVNFQPDWVWIKERNNAVDHKLYDAVRGATKVLESSNTGAEGTDVNGLTAFNSDGFSLGSSGSNNGSGDTYVSWNWLGANGTASNTDGSITTSVSANTTAGFSIVTYTGNSTAGATIGHGLGAVPSLILTKNRTSAFNWHLWTHAFSSYNDTIQLNTAAGIDTGTLLNNTAPTSSLITLGSSAVINESGSNQLAYVFAEKKGFSKFGSYTGNGSTDGTFIYTGFKPAWVMVKCTSAAESWDIKDNKRNPYNTCDNGLRANQNSADDINTTFHMIDYLSNGFKLRGANQNLVNGSGQSYIYMAFAENPLVGTNNIPATAR
jgi:hypothetical protein